MSLDIHQDIYTQLNTFFDENRVPNIIFHGRNGSGKKTIVKNYINKIYKTKEEQKKYVLIVDCIQYNGIKFIREDLKFFSRSQINKQHGNNFKTIILLNAGNLTIDAQSALRRCIEQYSNTTRFFIIIEDKSKILKPLISRFVDFFIPYPIIDNKDCNIYLYNKHKTPYLKQNTTKRQQWLKKYISENLKENNITNSVETLYNNGYNGKDLEDFIIRDKKFDSNKKCKLLIYLSKITKEIRDEKIILTCTLNNMFFRSNIDLENIDVN